MRLQADDVERVLAVVRRDFSGVEAEFGGFDVCFYCLGVSAAGMSEADYRRVAYGFALAAASSLARANPAMTFIKDNSTGVWGFRRWMSGTAQRCLSQSFVPASPKPHGENIGIL